MNTFFKIAYIIFFIILALMLLKFFLALFLITVILLWFRTWQMKREPNQQEFLAGKIPHPKLAGLYQGSMGFDVAWVGKKFNAQGDTGINLIKNKKGEILEKYPFKTYAGKGLFDENNFVLKIDYNVKGNPFWVKWIVDEIVEVAPNEYLGKMHVKIIPGFPFSILYFELKK